MATHRDPASQVLATPPRTVSTPLRESGQFPTVTPPKPGTDTAPSAATSVRDARLAAGMSQAQLAEAAHLNRSWVSLFESGHTPNASLGKVLAMLSALDITMRLTYPIPDPEEPATESDQTITPPPPPEPTPETRSDEARQDKPAALDPAALAAARAQRRIHRARALADEMAGNPGNGR